MEFLCMQFKWIMKKKRPWMFVESGIYKVNQKCFNKKLKKCSPMTLAKVKEQDVMTLAKGTRWDDSKVKEQDGMTLAKVRHAQVSHALAGAKYPTSAACTCIIWNLRGFDCIPVRAKLGQQIAEE